MPSTKDERKQQKRRKEQQEGPAKDILNKVFNSEQNTPVPKVLQVGLIDSNITYELARGNVRDTNEDFYTVRIASHTPGKRLEDLLMSGIFATRHEAQSYIEYLRSRNGQLQRI